MNRLISLIVLLALSCSSQAYPAAITNKSVGGIVTLLQSGTTAHVLTSNGPGEAPTFQANPASGITSLTGDVTGAGVGAVATTIADKAVTYAKIQNVSATDKLLGRATIGAGVIEEIPCTAAGRALIDDADAGAQRTTLGLGTAAVLASQTTMTDVDTHLPTGAAVKAYGDANWGGTGAPSFDAITSGTNTVANMIVGTGAALSFAGGTIDASHYKGSTVVSAVEFGYLQGVTSLIQGQINAKQNWSAYLVDIAGITANQGDIIYFNGTDWVDLGPGTAGTYLKTQGAGANPMWDTPPGGGMVYPGAGIALSTGTAWGTSITDNSANWNTAYTDRMKWDGGSTGLVTATGRTSLGLGSAATRDAEDTLTYGSNLPDGEAIILYGNANWSGDASTTLRSGSSTFNSTTGRTLTIDPVMPDTNYDVVISVGNQTGIEYIGEISIESKTVGSVVVKNSGSEATKAFDYLIIPHVLAANEGGSMVYPGAGIPLSTGTAWGTSIANNSSNWDTAYTDRLKWDGGATGLVPATGRTSLELGTAATRTAEDTLTNGDNLPDGAAIKAYGDANWAGGASEICLEVSTYTELDAAKNTSGCVLVTDNITLSANLTISADTTLSFVPGSVITTNGYTLTIAGGIDASPVQLFNENSTGIIQFTNNSYLHVVYAEWWGAKASGAAVDASTNTSAIQNAVNAIASLVTVGSPASHIRQGGVKLELLSGVYMINGTVTITHPVTIVGAGYMFNYNNNYVAGTRIWQTVDDPVFILNSVSDNTIITMEEFSIYSNISSPSIDTNAIHLENDGTGGVQLYVNKLFIFGGGYGFYHGINVEAGRLYATDCRVKGVYGNGIRIDASDMVVINRGVVEDTGMSGIYSRSLVIYITDLETFRCGSLGGTTDYYAVDANRAYIRGGYYNEGHNLIRISSGEVTGAYLEYAGKVGATYTNPDGIAITIYDASQYFESVTISGCGFYENGGNDINVIDNSSGYTKVSVIGNNFYSGGNAGSGGTADYSIYQGASGPPMNIISNNFKECEVTFAGNNVNFSDNDIVSTDTGRDLITFAASTTGHRCSNNRTSAGSGKNDIVVGSGAKVQTYGNITTAISGYSAFTVGNPLANLWDGSTTPFATINQGSFINAGLAIQSTHSEGPCLLLSYKSGASDDTWWSARVKSTGNLVFTTAGQSGGYGYVNALSMNKAGFIGINVDPDTTYRLKVNGQPAANGYTAWTNYSDIRMKENIIYVEEKYPSILSEFKKLRPIEFNYNNVSGYDEETKLRRIVGFSAQELLGVFPEMVGEFQKDGETYYDTNLSNLPTYNLVAIKELDIKVERLQQDIEQLKAQLAHKSLLKN